MKEFVKMTLATMAGLFIFGIVAFFFMFAMLGAVAAIGEKQPVMPREAVLKIDMSTFTLSEQSAEANPMDMLLAGGESVQPLGIYSAINAINAAASDPAVKFIYMKPDGVSGGTAQIEEFRKALKNFRNSGKAIVSYIESPGNGSYYLASVSDKIFMTPHDGAMNMFTGLSSQMIFLKDLLDKVGVNVQLIRHGKYKSAGEMFVRNSSSKENLEQNTEMVESLWGTWASEIAESRGISTEKLNGIINNLELNFPTDWVENGLVDELLNYNQLEDKLCDLFVAEKYEDVKGISLNDYATLKNTVNFKAKKKVAVIYATGDIVDGDAKENVAGNRFAKIISDVRKDSSVYAVVLRVNSPGGSVLASEKIKAELDLLRESKPIIASYGDYAASGGYWISANCDKIYSNASTLTGSIGVFSMIPDLGDVVKDKLHVTITPVNSNEHSDMYNGFRPLNQKELDYMQASVENIYDKFTKLVSEGRGMPVARVDEIAQGRVWTGADAIGIGLVDEIGTIEDAINYAALSIEGVTGVQDVQVVGYPKPQSTMEALLESLTGESTVLAGTAFENIEKAFQGFGKQDAGKAYARMPYVISVE
ncbi:MAG: signal peptide peptidase SppA [Bacteroidales bacterium]|nr:signal peptide peptidase SppA [Bacteroidales bacterium]